MPSFSFEVEYSKSNRAACKKCKSKIDKDVVRLGFKQEEAEGHVGCAWHHFGCFPTAKGAAWFKKHLLAEGDENIVGVDALKAEDKEVVLTLFKACRGEVPVPEAPSAPPAAATPPAKGKKRKGAEDVAPAEKVKVLTDEQIAAIATAKENLKSKNVAFLAAVLTKNGLPKAGAKDLLMERVAECQVLGVPPTCSRCDKKKLVWSKETGKYTCPGFFDDDSKAFKKCKGPEPDATIERKAWEE